MTPRTSKTAKTKRRIEPNEASGRGAFAAREESEVARLTRELNDALERQAATSEVLSMVVRHPVSLTPSSTRSWRKPHASAKPTSGFYFAWTTVWSRQSSCVDYTRPSLML
jgi:hypothetical protein